MGMTDKLRQDALALFDRRAPQVLAIEFEEVVLDLVNPAARCWRLLGRTGGQLDPGTSRGSSMKTVRDQIQ